VVLWLFHCLGLWKFVCYCQAVTICSFEVVSGDREHFPFLFIGLPNS